MKRNFTVTDALNQYSAEEKSNVITFIFIAAFLVFGVWGLYAWYNAQATAVKSISLPREIPGTEVNIRQNELYTNTKPEVPKKQRFVQKVNVKSELSPFETNVPINFVIEKTSPAVKYIFDFGDGVQRECKRKALEHTYRRAGTYKVKLKAYYEGKEATLWENVIRINRGVEVVG